MQVLTALGLSLDIIGVLLLFFYGLPPKINRDGANFLLVRTGSEEEEQEVRKAARNKVLSTIALWLIIGGFVLQLIGTVYPA